ncbi:autotransporter outer membrane beta-barrel domain-containing protein [Escherichia coli]|uniref:autotransporter outer membrane beta-barrel domain-containing protein n=1 Tax=Escherichia coli TaxID=562 RepID=UPI001FCEDC2E|nr:autotransporter outer membrane beta-barrel domain-containing protein [Escherichia coli]
MDINTSQGGLTGISAVSGGTVDLGVGSHVVLNNTGNNRSYGITANSQGRVRAKDINLSVVAEGGGTGMSLANSSSIVLTGSNNKITAISNSGATGIYAMGQQSDMLAKLEAENLSVETSGTGIDAQHYSVLNLTGSTVIKSVAGGIEAKGASYVPDGSGGIVNAERVSVSTTGSGSAGLYTVLGGRISAGAGSVVETENMHGLYATSDPGFPTTQQLTTIDFIGSETNRNTIQVNSRSGVTSMGENAFVTLENTDIKSSSKNADAVGLRALSGGVINARNISVISEDTGNGYQNIAAVLSRNSNARINISGDSYIDASRADNRVALLADGTGSEITVAERTTINGNVISRGDNASVDIKLSNGAVFSGKTDVVKEYNGNTYSGNSIRLSLTDSTWNMQSDSNLTSFMLNSGGVLNLNLLSGRQASAGNVLIIENDYAGTGGQINFNTVLAGDDSVTDKLIVRGNTDGTTFVSVNNAGGSGAQTLNGIELIHVDGQSNGDFIQNGRIAAGAYDYTLGRGQGSNSGNWYLTSGRNTPDPLPNPDPEPTPTPDPDSTPEPAPGGYDNDLRPEAGSYTANMVAANTMFVTRLHERLGPVQYTDVMTGETKNTSMWMRHEGGHNRWRDGTGQLKTQGNRYVVQLGGDIAQWGWGETDRWHLGVMAGYGNDHNNTDSVRTGYRSKGSVNGYSTGLYATWFANDETHNGAYLDTWAQYGWFDNHVKGDGLPGESWKSKGLTASLETGYTWKAGEFSGSHGSLNEWYVQPQAQVVWMGVKADEHRESNGTRVESTGDGNVRTRLGVKTWIKGHNRMDDGKSREFRPFVEMNWLHNTRDFGTRMNGVTVHQDGARNIGEVKAGVEGQINDRLNLWGNVGVQAGDKGYSDTSAMLGVKYTF